MEPKIISVTPAGRKRYLEILVPYLLLEKYKGNISKHIFWINTFNEDDINYLNEICTQHSDFFELLYMPEEVRDCNCKCFTHFYKHCCESNTIYIKIDDDICWIDDYCIKNLIQCRKEYIEPLLIIANTINHPICSHLHQRFNILPIDFGIVKYDPYDNYGWMSGEFAKFVHEYFLNNLKNNNTKNYYFSNWFNWENIRTSINMISWWGSTMKNVYDLMGNNDEQSLSVDIPNAINTSTIIAGNALAVHFAYFTQREYLESSTNLLTVYKQISENS